MIIISLILQRHYSLVFTLPQKKKKKKNIKINYYEIGIKLFLSNFVNKF